MKTMLSLALLLGLSGWLSAAMAEGSVSAGQAKAARCASCHGVDGNSPSPVFPKLAGQIPEYLVKQMRDFQTGARKDDVMAPQVAGLSEQDLLDLAAYYASQKITIGSATVDDVTLKLGERLYRGGNAKFGVSACMSCHGPSGHGIPPRYPRVSGQHAAYTAKQMRLFKDSKRTNDGDVMTRIAFRMSDKEIQAVSEYMAGLH